MTNSVRNSYVYTVATDSWTTIVSVCTFPTDAARIFTHTHGQFLHFAASISGDHRLGRLHRVQDQLHTCLWRHQYGHAARAHRVLHVNLKRDIINSDFHNYYQMVMCCPFSSYNTLASTYTLLTNFSPGRFRFDLVQHLGGVYFLFCLKTPYFILYRSNENL